MSSKNILKGPLQCCLYGFCFWGENSFLKRHKAIASNKDEIMELHFSLV